MTSYSRAIIFFTIVAALFCSTYAEVVQSSPCRDDENNGPSMCTIHEVRVNPCKGAATGKPCRIKGGRNASIGFDYTATFEGDKLETYVYWVNDIANLPFIDMERDACLSTPCPAVPNKKQTYHFNMLVAKSYPPNTYKVKWLMQNAQGQNCCFLFDMVLA